MYGLAAVNVGWNPKLHINRHCPACLGFPESTPSPDPPTYFAERTIGKLGVQAREVFLCF